MGDALPPSVVLDAITQFLSGDDWRQEKRMRAFIDSNCVLFDGDLAGEYSHVHHEVWQEFMKQVDAILSNLVTEIGGRIEDVENALRAEAKQRVYLRLLPKQRLHLRSS